jgi:hypothetical protein
MNAKQEFLAEVKGKNILCAVIKKSTGYDDNFIQTYDSYYLHIGYSFAFYDGFIDTLDFDYNNGYGGQELFGTIWYTDGTWSERGVYEGSEWWNYIVYPKIPKVLGRKWDIADIADSWQR